MNAAAWIAARGAGVPPTLGDRLRHVSAQHDDLDALEAPQVLDTAFLPSRAVIADDADAQHRAMLACAARRTDARGVRGIPSRPSPGRS